MKKIILFLGLLTSLWMTPQLTALPVNNGFAPGVVQGETTVIAQWFHLNAYVNRDAPNFWGLDSTYTADAIALGLVYAIKKNIIPFLFMPWIRQNFKFNAPPNFTNAVRGQSKTAGWGDLSFSVAFRPWEYAAKGWLASMLIQPGCQFPTGDWNQKSHGIVADREIQPGRGNWAPFLSVVASILGKDNEATVNLQYQHSFKQHGFRHGHLFIYNASIGHRVIPWFLTAGEKRVWATLSIEFLGQYKSRPSGTPNLVNTWSNWGRISPAFNLEFADIMRAFNIKFGLSMQQTIYYKTGDQYPIRPERAYIVSMFSNW